MQGETKSMPDTERGRDGMMILSEKNKNHVNKS